MHELIAIRDGAARSLLSGERAVIATVLKSEGSSFRRAGARVLLTQSSRAGAISGGCLESDLWERAGAGGSEPALVSYDTSRDSDILWGTASGCGGRLLILLEPASSEFVENLSWVIEQGELRKSCVLSICWSDGTLRVERHDDSRLITDSSSPPAQAIRSGKSLVIAQGEELTLHDLHRPPIALTLFGRGEDAHALARRGEELGWSVNLSLAGSPLTGPLPSDRRSAIMVMTHDFMRDLAILESLRGRCELGYLGVLGPRRRTSELLSRLEATAAEFPALKSPPGLDLGGETPEEISLSIAAEIAATLNARSGAPLSERGGPIHEPVPAIGLPTLKVAND